MNPTRNIENQVNDESVDQLVQQSIVDVALHRVRLPGFYSALHAQAVVAQSPEEIAAIQVGVEPSGSGVFALFWLPTNQQSSSN